MSNSREGGCQCGAIRYRLEGDPIAVAICHCTECKRQSGSAFGMSLVVRQEAFHLLRGDLKTYDRIAESGRHILAHFCPGCGNRIYSRTGMRDGTLSVKPGTLDDTSFLTPTLEIWTVRKHGWIELPRDLPSHECNPLSPRAKV